jgi:hypothetical protein
MSIDDKYYEEVSDDCTQQSSGDRGFSLRASQCSWRRHSSCYDFFA